MNEEDGVDEQNAVLPLFLCWTTRWQTENWMECNWIFQNIIL